MTERVTLVIPTMNRPKLLFRQLKYYASQGFSGDILVADSSVSNEFRDAARWMVTLSGDLSLKHYHLPNLSVAQAISEVACEVRTPYVAVIPDDDFLIPSGVSRCVNFLDRDDRYIAAHGLGVLIESNDGGVDSIAAAGYYPQPTLSADLAVDRVIDHMEDYAVTLFSVHRTDTWVQVFASTPSVKDAPLCCDRSFADELLQCVLTAAHGRIAQIKGIYLVRQTHNARNFLPSWYEWMVSDKWQPSCMWFRDKVASVISEIDHIPFQRAQDAVDVALAKYLQKTIGTVHAGRSSSRLRVFVDQSIPSGAKALLRKWRSRFGSEYISLEGLADQSSPYHHDFLGVYQSVTGRSVIAGES